MVGILATSEIDEVVLQTKIGDLQTVLYNLQHITQQVTHTYNLLSDIALRLDGSPIIDKGTGIEMTQKRRKEVYDRCIIIADKLLDDISTVEKLRKM